MAVKRVMLVSNGYPDADAREKGFILPELKAFLAAGYEVTVAPIHPIRRLDPDLPTEVLVAGGLAAMYRLWRIPSTLAALLKAGFFWREARIAAEHGRVSGILHFLKESIRAMSILRFAATGSYDVLYTYWFKGETAGIAFLPPDGAVRVTRAHGYDLYENRPHNKGYIPYRAQTLPLLDRVIFLSSEARDYVAQRYPTVTTSFIVSPLGVAHEPVCNPPPQGKTIHLVSCSYATPNKRLPLIAALAVALAQEAKWDIKWTHFGCSRHQAGLRGFRSPVNLTIEFTGEVPNSYIRQWYRENSVDFFINLSESEGQPVSIMEAMAFGIPVLATGVGGVPEMLQYGGGVLLPETPDVRAVARQIMVVRKDLQHYARMRAEALNVQQTYFNTAENHRKLVASIDDLLT